MLIRLQQSPSNESGHVVKKKLAGVRMGIGLNLPSLVPDCLQDFELDLRDLPEEYHEPNAIQEMEFFNVD